jgi:putative endonuclease
MGRVPFIAAVSSQWRSLRSLWSERFSPTAEAPHLVLGRRGEKLAARHLNHLGYKVLYRNFRHGAGGEIDIVCRHGEVLVFVEVKTRSSEDFGRPLDAVDRKKQWRIVRGAMAWLRMLDLPDLTFRFDVVEVLMSEPVEIRVIENAFHMPSSYYY